MISFVQRLWEKPIGQVLDLIRHVMAGQERVNYKLTDKTLEHMCLTRLVALELGITQERYSELWSKAKADHKLHLLEYNFKKDAEPPEFPEEEL